MRRAEWFRRNATELGVSSGKNSRDSLGFVTSKIVPMQFAHEFPSPSGFRWIRWRLIWD